VEFDAADVPALILKTNAEGLVRAIAQRKAAASLSWP
jgi:hypothetical protein